jgi:Ca-activated chloride channel homolog
MTERDLENLKSLPVPTPGEPARARAIAAAMAAFDAQSENSDGATQGTEAAARHISTSDPKMRRTPMTSIRAPYALAASVAALAVAVPALLHVMREGPKPLVGGETISKKVNGSPEPQPVEDAGRSVTVTPPLVVDRKEMAAKGADPAQRPLSQPTDGLGAAGGSSNHMSISIGGGKPEPAPEPAKPSSPQLSEIDNSRNASIAKQKKEATAKSKGDQERRTALAGRVDSTAPAAAPATGAAAPMPVLSLDKAAPQSERGRIANLAHPEPYLAQAEEHRDQHTSFEDGAVKQVATDPVSTFSIDVDTASYAFARKALNAGRLPQKNAVRVEEMINYFPYAYPAPESADAPFKPAVSIFPAPWNAAHKLVHIGIKGYTLQAAERPRANLVFLIDTSGSMSPADRLPLIKNAFAMLVDQLKPDDTVGIVTYAGNTSIALKPTKAANKADILAAIGQLGAGGSTAGAQGIQDAYALAEANFDATGVNRIILATDGDFNVGITNQNELKSFVERKREKGIFLSILGVGMGNYNDAMMQTLAQNGNGVAAYVDTLNEARKVLVEEASSSLFTIAKDVKIQVEFNPAAVSEYRLIGYETRALKREDFNNDKVDAGDVGSGHTVTAIYEITPVGSEAPSVDPLRYGANPATPARRTGNDTGRPEPANEFGFLKLRYKLPKEDASKLLTMPLTAALETRSIADASPDARFSAAVAAYGQLLRGSPHIKNYTYDDVATLAQSARGDDPFGYRAEFLNLARLAKTARK